MPESSSPPPEYELQQTERASERPVGPEADRAWCASCDVDLSAPWPAFREQLARLEERLLAEPDRPMPPPTPRVRAHYFDGTGGDYYPYF